VNFSDVFHDYFIERIGALFFFTISETTNKVNRRYIIKMMYRFWNLKVYRVEIVISDLFSESNKVGWLIIIAAIRVKSINIKVPINSLKLIRKFSLDARLDM